MASRGRFSWLSSLLFVIIIISFSNGQVGERSVVYAKTGENGFSGILTIYTTEGADLEIRFSEAPPPGSYQLRFFDVQGRMAAQGVVEVRSASSALPITSDFFPARLARGVYLFQGLSTSQSSEFQPMLEPFFQDISQTHLPGDSTQAAFSEFADFNGDSLPDIFLAISNTAAPEQPQILINAGGGMFQNETASRLPQLLFWANDLAVFDADGDGDQDIYLAGDDGSGGMQGKDRLWLNDGSGHFSDVTATHLPALPAISFGVAWGDVNQDNYPDVALTHIFLPGNPINTPLVLLQNDGSGHFSDASHLLPASKYNAYDATLGDVDGDMRMDIVLASLGDLVISDQMGNPIDTLSGRNAVLIQTSAGQFVDETTQRMPDIRRASKNMKIADLNNDQRPELYSINIGFTSPEASNVLYWNDGSGFFSDETGSRLPPETVIWNNDAEFTDFQGDTQIDLFMINVMPGGTAPDNLYFNDGGFFSEQSQHLPPLIDFNISSATADVDQDLDSDIFISAAGTSVGQPLPDLLYENIIAATAVDPQAGPARRFSLSQNYPNPFNPSTEIGFRIAEFGFVELTVYDLLGRRVKTLVNGELAPDRYRVLWDGNDDAGKPVASGVYYYQLRAAGFLQTRKMVLLR